MGHTLLNLSSKDLPAQTIFNSRFVVEICEKVHVHYRNLRINLSMQDWVEMCTGMVQALERWKKQGCPESAKGVHIELCRKKVATDAHNDGIKVNFNQNLYPANEGRIFAEGAEFRDENYVHLKIRDLRLEMPVSEFKELADAIAEASKRLQDCHITAGL